MISARNVGRRISSKLDKTVSELYSADYDNKLTDNDFSEVVKATEELKKQNIYYVDEHGDVPTIEKTILDFSQSEYAKGKWVIITLDHTLLVTAKQSDSERKVISDLQYMFIRLKKNKSFTKTILQLSQVNRDLESNERKNNPAMHFPQRSDIFGSEAVYQCSDYVWFIHSPSRLGLTTYGPRNWPTNGYVYIHAGKNRDGEAKILVFKDELKYNRLIETSLTEENKS